MIRELLTILSFLCLPVMLSAQHIGNTDWKTEIDFRTDEHYVVENILWLEDNPLATPLNDTKALSEYVLQWLSNAPYVSVKLDEIFLAGIVNNRKYKYAEKFKVTYLFGKAIYAIQNKGETDEALASQRGVVAMVKVYRELKKNDPEAKNRVLEKYSKMYKGDRLEGYIRTELNKQESSVN